MGLKYIIELEDDAFEQDGSADMLFRAKGFNSLVFDQNGIDKLTPYDPEADYQHGLDEAWKAARFLRNAGITDDTWTARQMVEHYHRMTPYPVICAGDEVVFNTIEKDGLEPVKGVVLDRGADLETWLVLMDDGYTGTFGESMLTRTGRTYTEARTLLDGLRAQTEKPETERRPNGQH